MSKTATLRGKIALDDSEFNKVLRRATDRAKKFGADAAAAIGSAAKAGLIGLGVAGVGAAGGLLAAAKAAADLGGQLSDASAITGISADKMLVLQQAFKNAGMSGEGAAGVIAKLQASIGRAGVMSDETEEEVSALRDSIAELEELKGTGLDPKELVKVNKQIEKAESQISKLESDARGVQEAFKLLGLNDKLLAQMDGADQLQAVFEALGKLNTQSDKMAALRMLRLPPDLMVLAKDPNAFKNARIQLGSLIDNVSNSADAFDRVSDILGSKFTILFQQIGAGFLASIIDNPVFQRVVDKFEALDFGFIGEAIGTRVSAAIDFIDATIKAGTLSETLSGVLKTGFAYAMEYFVMGMGILFATLGGVMASVFSSDGMTFITAFGAALTGVLIIAAFNFGKLLMSAWYDLEQRFADSPLGRVLGGLKAGAGVLQMTGTAIPSLVSDDFAELRDEGYRKYGEGLRTMIDGGDADLARLKQFEALNNQDVRIGGMTQAELMKATTEEFGRSVEALGLVVSDIPNKVKESYDSINVDEIRRPAAENAAGAAANFYQTLTPEQQRSIMGVINGGRAQNTAPMPVQQGPNAPFQSTMPSFNNRQTSVGDGQAVSVLEQIASLLDRNLSALQVA